MRGPVPPARRPSYVRGAELDRPRLSMPRPGAGSTPGASGGRVTSGSGRCGRARRGPAGGDWCRASPAGRAGRPCCRRAGRRPGRCPSRTGWGCAAAVAACSPAEPAGRRRRRARRRAAVAGALRRRPRPLVACAGLRRGCGQQRLQRADLLVYGVEDRADLVADVAELDGQPVAQVRPRSSRWRPGEGGERLDGAERAVALVRRVQQAVALGGVVRMPARARRISPSDSWSSWRRRGRAPSAGGPRSAGWRPGRDRARRGRRRRRPGPSWRSSMPRLSPYSESPGRASELAAATPPKAPAATPTVSPPAASPLVSRERGSQLPPSGGGPVGALVPRLSRCSGTGTGPCAPPPGGALAQHGLHAATSWARWTTLDLGVQSPALGQSRREPSRQRPDSRPLLRLGSGSRAAGSPTPPSGCSAAAPSSDLLLQGLGEGVRPPVRRYVRDHWRHLLSS